MNVIDWLMKGDVAIQRLTSNAIWNFTILKLAFGVVGYMDQNGFQRIIRCLNLSIWLSSLTMLPSILDLATS